MEIDPCQRAALHCYLIVFCYIFSVIARYCVATRPAFTSNQTIPKGYHQLFVEFIIPHQMLCSDTAPHFGRIMSSPSSCLNIYS